LKAPTRPAGAKVIPTELLEKLLVPMHDAEAAADLGFREVAPSSAYCSSRKQGRLSKSSSWRMTHLHELGRCSGELAQSGDCARLEGGSPWSSMLAGTSPNKALEQTIGALARHEAPLAAQRQCYAGS